MSDWVRDLLSQALPSARVVEVTSAPGGISGDTRFVRLAKASGETVELAVKRPGARFGRRDPVRVEREFRLLEAAYSAGIPVARPVYMDPELLAMAMERLPGAPAFHPPDPIEASERMADLSAAVHLAFTGETGRAKLAAALAAGLSEMPRSRESYAAPAAEPDESLGETRIRNLLAAAWPPPPNPMTLVHGDLWPGNVLWSDGHISGLIDWEDARLGDPLDDIGITRLDIWWQYGEEAMEAFTERYFSLVPWTAEALPVWDLVAALRPCGQIQDWAHGLDDVISDQPPITEEHMRSVHARFVARAAAS